MSVGEVCRGKVRWRRGRGQGRQGGGKSLRKREKEEEPRNGGGELLRRRFKEEEEARQGLSEMDARQRRSVVEAR